MASSVQHIDNEEKTTVETLYSNGSINAIPIAHALLDEGYDSNGMSNDLWSRLTNTYVKRAQLSQVLRPAGGSFTRVTILRRFAPRTPLTWTMLQNGEGENPTPSDRNTASRNQKNLKQLLLARDGQFSVVGGRHLMAGQRFIAARIIPFSASNRGQEMDNLLTGQSSNDPSIALLLSPDEHQAFDKFKFGLECRDGHYFLRILFSHHFGGEELFFGQEVALPSALLCNIQLAVGRILRASGAAETIDKILEDEDHFNCGNLEGDYSLRVGASYLERELRALQGLDELAIDRQDNIMDSDSEEDLPVTTHAICT
ncbi:hypothetical protein V1515DRAFT_639564 [Lipomyces mesembrius]